LRWLAHDLCAKLGFCGIGRQIQNLRDLRMMHPADWADEVFRAEEMDPSWVLSSGVTSLLAFRLRPSRLVDP
jgi:hypothetical protein